MEYVAVSKWPPNFPSSPFEVGYRKPPKAHRFKPGHSGNPNGHPKRKRLGSVEEIIRDELTRTVTVTENGKPSKLPVGKLIARQFIAQAAKGNAKAFTTTMKLIETNKPSEEELALREEKMKLARQLADSMVEKMRTIHRYRKLYGELPPENNAKPGTES